MCYSRGGILRVGMKTAPAKCRGCFLKLSGRTEERIQADKKDYRRFFAFAFLAFLFFAIRCKKLL